MTYIYNEDKLVGLRIKARRKLLRMTQKDLAALVGITAQQIQKYENGVNKINVHMLMAISNALKVSPESFLKKDVFGSNDTDELEDALLYLFRSIKSKSIKVRIIELIRSLVEEFK